MPKKSLQIPIQDFEIQEAGDEKRRVAIQKVLDYPDDMDTIRKLLEPGFLGQEVIMDEVNAEEAVEIVSGYLFALSQAYTVLELLANSPHENIYVRINAMKSHHDVAISPSSYDVLEQGLRHSDLRIVKKTLQLLERIDGKKALELIQLATLREDSDIIMSDILEALHLVKGVDSDDFLFSLLDLDSEQADWHFQVSVLNTLKDDCSDKAFHVFMEASRHSNFYIRNSAISALFFRYDATNNIDQAKAIELRFYEVMEKDESLEMRVVAAENIIVNDLSRKEEAISFLIGILESENSELSFQVYSFFEYMKLLDLPQVKEVLKRKQARESN